MVKFRDRLLDIVERHYEGKMTVGGMMDAFDEVIADIEASSRVGVAAPPAQDADSDWYSVPRHERYAAWTRAVAILNRKNGL